MRVRYGYAGVLLLLLVGCDDDSNGGFDPPSQDPQGFWVGQSSSASGAMNDVDCLIAPNREIACVFDDAVSQDVFSGANGVVSVRNTDQVTGSGNTYTVPPAMFPDGSVFTAFSIPSGTVEGRATLTMTFSAAGDSANLSLVFDLTYDRGASFIQVAGDYALNLSGDLGTLTIGPQGGLGGLMLSGCIFSGQVQIFDPLANAYDVSFSLSNCGLLDGSYDGLGMTDATVLVDDTFNFTVSNSTNGLVGSAVR